MVSGGGLKPDTLMKQQRSADDFNQYVPAQSKNDRSLQGILDAKDSLYLEDCLMGYFESFRVGVKDENTGEVTLELPKRNTLESYKFSQKNWILIKTHNEIDIMNKSLFPRFTMLMKGLCRELKKEGIGDTTHHEALDKASLGKEEKREKSTVTEYRVHLIIFV